MLCLMSANCICKSNSNLYGRQVDLLVSSIMLILFYRYPTTQRNAKKHMRESHQRKMPEWIYRVNYRAHNRHIRVTYLRMSMQFLVFLT